MPVSIKRCVFAAGCVSAIAVSAIYPAWGAIQKNEAYGGYVDIALQSLGLEEFVVAGTQVTMPVRISNLGPESAEFPQVIFSADNTFRLTATSGCKDSPLASNRCHLEAPLGAGESRDVSFIGALSPAARGLLSMGSFGMSEAIDVQAGNEQVIAVPRIVPQVDLRVIATDGPRIDERGRVIWEVEIDNQGVSDSLTADPRVWGFPVGDALVECTPVGPHARCPSSSFFANVGIDSRLRYRMTFPPMSVSWPLIEASISVSAFGELELNKNDNMASMQLTDSLFSDHFEF